MMLAKTLKKEKFWKLLKEGVFENYICEQKYDGVRAVYINGSFFGRGRNRDLVPMTFKFPELKSKLKGSYDGEIVSKLGRFSDTQSRARTENKFKIIQLSKDNPCYFMVFDVIKTEDKTDMTASPLMLRKKHLEKVVFDNPNWKKVPYSYDIYKIHDLNIKNEGIVIKDDEGAYYWKKRTNVWLKVKNTKQKMVKFVSHEDNSDGSITLVSKDGDVRVRCCDKSQTSGKAIVEYLEETDNERLRMPVFKRWV